MNIKEVKTEQFAGIRNQRVTLVSGLNILVGNNEIGKSTIINLIYRLLYQKSKIKRNETEGKDFLARFMPSNGKGDVIDGTLVFTTEEGQFSLHKEWGEACLCELIDSNGDHIRKEETIREILDDKLVYKQGLYKDVVFVSQKNQADIVEYFLKKLNDKEKINKQTIVSIISAEGMSSIDNILPEDLEEEIQNEIKALAGNWNFVLDCPKEKTDPKRWSNGNGKVITAYYRKEDLVQSYKEAIENEKRIDNINDEIKKLEEKKTENNNKKRQFDQYSFILNSFLLKKKQKQDLEKKKEKLCAAYNSYPETLKAYDEATQLLYLTKVEQIFSSFQKMEQTKKKLIAKQEVCLGDISNLETIERDITVLSANLSNINIVANIKKLGDTDIIIKSAVSGEFIDISNEIFEINETVEVIIPGIMSMQVAPKGIDVASIQKQLEEKKKSQCTIFEKYGVSNQLELKELQKEYAECEMDYQSAKAEFERILICVKKDGFEVDSDKVKDQEPLLEGLWAKIASLCGEESITDFHTRKKNEIFYFEKEYGKENIIETIKHQLSIVDDEIKELGNFEEEFTNIPEEYRIIEDVDAYKKSLESESSAINQKITEKEKEKTAAEKDLGDNSVDDLREKLEQADDEFKKLKKEYERWNHILNVLRTTRDNMRNDSALNDVKEKFAAYLSVITDGRISLDSMDENMDVTIHSGNNLLSYEILSEGTKDTIALAFRLAMLEHLFPNGGGLVILDDPFTEMDENRTKQACKLVQKFADAGNQVIFVTCDNKYKNLLSGNVIEM